MSRWLSPQRTMAKYTVTRIHCVERIRVLGAGSGVLESPTLYMRGPNNTFLPFEVTTKDGQLFYTLNGTTYSTPIANVRLIEHYTPATEEDGEAQAG